MGNCSNKSEVKDKEKVPIQTVSKNTYQMIQVIGKGGFGRVIEYPIYNTIFIN